MQLEIVLLLIFCALATNSVEGLTVMIYKFDEDFAEPKYSYDYAVSDFKTGDTKSQWETRIGGIVKGEYSLVEPDGTLRTVRYKSDPHNGFNALVKRVHPNGYATLNHY